MSDLEEKIKSILDSPEGINQIVSAAQTLFGKEEGAESVQPETTADEGLKNEMPAIKEESNLLDQLDPKVISTAMQIMGEYRRTDDRRIQLLHALRSYFKEDDQIHITKAIQIVKLSKVAKQAFRSIREEDMFV